MKSEIDNYFLKQPEPAKSCLLALRALILTFAPGITEVWRYRMPFYQLDGRRFCYLWTRRQDSFPYLGIVNGREVNHQDLQTGDRSRMKILPVDPAKDIQVRKVRAILRMALQSAT